MTVYALNFQALLIPVKLTRIFFIEMWVDIPWKIDQSHKSERQDDLFRLEMNYMEHEISMGFLYSSLK